MTSQIARGAQTSFGTLATAEGAAAPVARPGAGALSDIAAKREKSGAERASPLVSVIMFVRNGMPHVQRALKSVLSQDYENLEFVIQDGASTDGTVEHIKSLDDPRIKLVSETDDGPADAFARAMARCQGDIIASCLADEELHPDALSRVVAIFAANPHLGCITGDADITDIHGDTYGKFEGGPFNLIRYLRGEYCPYWCSSFFKTDALRFVGIFDNRWSRASLEFEVWCRLSMETDIHYAPQIFSKYAHHSGQLSQAGGRVTEELDARIDIISNRLFGRGTYFGEQPALRDVFILLQLKNLYMHLSTWNPVEAEKVLQRMIDGNYLAEYNAARDHATDGRPLKRGAQPARSGMTIDGGRVSADFVPGHEFLVPQGGRMGRLYRALVPAFIRAAIPRDLKVRIAYAIGLRKRG